MRISYKIIGIIIILLILPDVSGAHPDLVQLNKTRIKINQIAMLTLGGWALINMTSSGLILPHASGEKKYFYQMNIYWNAVNLAIGGFGYFGSQEQPDSLSFAESVREQVNIEKILLLNAGLDIAYITAGLFLLEKQNADKKMKGYGRSVILQGSFLLAFDVIMYLMHNQNNQAYFDIIKNISISDKGISVKINF